MTDKITSNTAKTKQSKTKRKADKNKMKTTDVGGIWLCVLDL